MVVLFFNETRLNPHSHRGPVMQHLWECKLHCPLSVEHGALPSFSKSWDVLKSAITENISKQARLLKISLFLLA